MSLENILNQSSKIIIKPIQVVSSKKNRRAILSFTAAFAISLGAGMATSSYLKRNNFSDLANTAVTFMVRNGVYFSIYLPLHKKAHRRDYDEGERNESHEMGGLAKGSALGAVSNLILQPSLHYPALHWLNLNPSIATGAAYITGGGISTLLMGTYLYLKRILK